jgi:hypothetical protein
MAASLKVAGPLEGMQHDVGAGGAASKPVASPLATMMPVRARVENINFKDAIPTFRRQGEERFTSTFFRCLNAAIAFDSPPVLEFMSNETQCYQLAR